MSDLRVLIQTSMGDITVELNQAKAPISVANFLSYVDDKFYDGTIFHRVIPDFMIQGGGFEPGMKQKKVKAPIKNESGNGLSNTKGTIAMARTSDMDSATAQFYLNTVDNAGHLDKAKYCVFGKIVSGLDVVEKIRAVKTGKTGSHGDVPTENVMITSIARVD